jgi:DNA/RNA-binding domain of Phe-tRNA-synthetase-like protein
MASSMKFKIDPRIFEKFPGLMIGIISCQDLNNTGNEASIQKETRAQENNIRAKYNTETLSQLPKINIWRKAYSAFGGKPKEIVYTFSV